jgi:hypothetical protein
MEKLCWKVKRYQAFASFFKANSACEMLKRRPAMLRPPCGSPDAAAALRGAGVSR